MANMRSINRRPIMVVPYLEDIVRLKRYARERGFLNPNGTENISRAISSILMVELRRRYPHLTFEERQWCLDQEEKNMASRKFKKVATYKRDPETGRMQHDGYKMVDVMDVDPDKQ